MFNRLVKYFLENRLITFILLIAFVVMGLVTMPFSLKSGLLRLSIGLAGDDKIMGERFLKCYREVMGN